jgi:hypothetical protein
MPAFSLIASSIPAPQSDVIYVFVFSTTNCEMNCSFPSGGPSACRLCSSPARKGQPLPPPAAARADFRKRAAGIKDRMTVLEKCSLLCFTTKRECEL